jgi:hypothetical protein
MVMLLGVRCVDLKDWKYPDLTKTRAVRPKASRNKTLDITNPAIPVAVRLAAIPHPSAVASKITNRMQQKARTIRAAFCASQDGPMRVRGAK